MESSTSLPSERLHVWEEGIRCLQKACEAGAREASGWIGRRNKEKADAATALAMRQVLATLPEPARVVSGEGLKDEVEHLATGEIMGLSSERLYFDLAVDPIEGTSNLANGLPWALCVAAVTPFKALFDPGPSLYMEKIVVPQPAVRHIDPNADIETFLRDLARGLGKSVRDLRVFVLDKPRHHDLAAQIVAAGASVAFFPAGDAIGTCLVAMNKEFDAVLGIGGTPEGLLSACAVRALGAGFFGRLAPQREAEKKELLSQGFDLNSWMSVGEIVRSSHCAFFAAGITDSPLVRGVRRTSAEHVVSLLTIRGPEGTVDHRHG